MKKREFQVGPDGVLLLDVNGKLEGFRLRHVGALWPTDVVSIPGGGRAGPFPTVYKGTSIRYWTDADGRVVAAQVL